MRQESRTATKNAIYRCPRCGETRHFNKGVPIVSCDCKGEFILDRILAPKRVKRSSRRRGKKYRYGLK